MTTRSDLSVRFLTYNGTNRGEIRLEQSLHIVRQ